MIYLDNSATTYPKPLSVRRKMAQALEQFGANPGRGGVKMSLQTAQAGYDGREVSRMCGRRRRAFFRCGGPGVRLVSAELHAVAEYRYPLVKA